MAHRLPLYVAAFALVLGSVSADPVGAVSPVETASLREVGSTQNSPLLAIESDRAAGLIGDSDALLFQFYLVSDPTRLPARYAGMDPPGLRCATQIRTEMHQALANFPSSLRSELRELLGPPDGLGAHLDTEHFRIHYAPSGVRSPQGWPDTAYLDAVADAAEKSWGVIHEQSSWQLPPADGPSGGDSRTDIYIDDLGTGFYGYTEPDRAPADYWPHNRTAFIVIDNDYAGFGYTDPLPPMRVTVAHEYHHVVQMGYTVANGWWMENLSTFMEDEVYDEIDDNHAYLSCLTSAPYRTLSTFDGCHEYGAFVWPTWLAENYGPDLNRRVQACAGIDGLYSCLNRELQDVGSSLDEAVAEFWTWNFYTGARDDGDHYAEGASYPAQVAYDRSFSEYPQVDQHPSSSRRPEAFGASVMRFRPAFASSHNLLTINFRGPASTQRVVLIQKMAGEEVFIEHYLDLQPDQSGGLDVRNWDTTEYAHLYVIMNRASGGGEFDYAIDVETSTQAAAIGDQSEWYSRKVVLDPNEPNPFRGFTQIRYALIESGRLRLEIFDAAGRLVRSLVNTTHDIGEYSVSWDGRDAAGERVEPGVYFYRVQAAGSQQSRKMIVMQD